MNRVKTGLEVAICGASPLWDGIEEDLRGKRLRVRRLGDSMAEAVREIRMLSPDAILFEISQADTAAVAALMRRFPGTKLIGFRPQDRTFVVFSAGEQPVLAADELAAAIIGSEADGG